MIDLNYYEQRIHQLECELDEMTSALSQAWDQLVPFLQDIPDENETTQNIEPILHTVAAAADAEIAGVYLFETNTWQNIPERIPFKPEILKQLVAISKPQIVHLRTETGVSTLWAFAPVITGKECIGVLGIGTYNLKHQFNTVDLRIIMRMAERIGSQVTATQLSRLREKEMFQQHELRIANRIQQSVQPANPPKNARLEMDYYWQPAREVGGDAWGWVQTNEEQLTWFILDVAGKGLPAAIAAVALHSAIAMALHMHTSPINALKMINKEFYEAYTQTDLMATVAILSLNTKTGALELANAGHPPILVRHKGEWLRFEATVPPIGVLPRLQPEMQLLMLQPDDLIITYSDGFSEIQTEKRLWGQTGLLEAVPSGNAEAQTITKRIVSASQKIGLVEDDQTLITTVYKGE